MNPADPILLVHTENAPAAIGPYSQAVCAQGLLFSSGQIALRPDGRFLAEDAAGQAKQIFANLDAVLSAAGCTRNDVLKVQVYLLDLEEFGAVNEVYEAWFGDHRPARVCVQVARLPKDAAIEVDLIARHSGTAESS